MTRKKVFLFVCLLMLAVPEMASAADCNNGGRYEDNGDWTVTDCRTGLIWLVMANCKDTAGGIDKSNGGLSWYEAMKWAAGLQNGICNLTDNSAAGDWRLPTKTEWMAMIASAKKQGFTNPILTNGAGTDQYTYGDAFVYVQSSLYWSSTPSATDNLLARIINLYQGNVFYYIKPASYYVWPVRGGQSGSFGNLFIQ